MSTHFPLRKELEPATLQVRYEARDILGGHEADTSQLSIGA
jgi:hypothetical protein